MVTPNKFFVLPTYFFFVYLSLLNLYVGIEEKNILKFKYMIEKELLMGEKLHGTET